MLLARADWLASLLGLGHYPPIYRPPKGVYLQIFTSEHRAVYETLKIDHLSVNCHT